MRKSPKSPRICPKSYCEREQISADPVPRATTGQDAN